MRYFLDHSILTLTVPLKPLANAMRGTSFFNSPHTESTMNNLVYFRAMRYYHHDSYFHEYNVNTLLLHDLIHSYLVGDKQID